MMKLYKVEFSGTYTELKAIPQIKDLNIVWEKEYSHPDHKYGDEHKEANEELALIWKDLTVEEVIEQWKGKKGIKIDYDHREQLITSQQLDQCFNYCTIKQVLEFDSQAQVQAIDIKKLADSVSSMLLGKISENMFNQKLEIHQPNMPLFTYNDFKVMYDQCTESLQDEINNGYRVVAVLPQPDQRRPDYVLGRYTKESK
jgi:hypothetical protein